MNPFRFKQFTIHQDSCAMKVGTDGVLLGAWTSLINQPDRILDIGAGTGLIALMLAQRSAAELIDAIEIDAEAYGQCVANFEASAWADRLFCYHAGLDEFVDEMDEKYDLIISNPPFYAEDVPSGKKSRDLARQNQSLPFDELLDGVAGLLASAGTFSTILPYKEEDRFISLASNVDLFPQKIVHVKGHATADIKRSLLEFGFEKNVITRGTLTIELGRHQYTPEYIAMTKDFYLKL